MINFPKNLYINKTEWELNPIKFDTDKIFPKSVFENKNFFGFYGSEFQPFNQYPFWDGTY